MQYRGFTLFCFILAVFLPVISAYGIPPADVVKYVSPQAAPVQNPFLQRLRHNIGEWRPLAEVIAEPVISFEGEGVPEGEFSGAIMGQWSSSVLGEGEGGAEGEGEDSIDSCPIGFYDWNTAYPSCEEPMAEGYFVDNQTQQTLRIYFEHQIPGATVFSFDDFNNVSLAEFDITSSTFDQTWTYAQLVAIGEVDHITIRSTTYPSGAVVGIFECPQTVQIVQCTATLDDDNPATTEAGDAVFTFDPSQMQLELDLTHDLTAAASLQFLASDGTITLQLSPVLSPFHHEFTIDELAMLSTPGAFDTLELRQASPARSLEGRPACLPVAGDVFVCPIPLDANTIDIESMAAGWGGFLMAGGMQHHRIFLNVDLSGMTEVQFRLPNGPVLFSVDASGNRFDHEFTPCEWQKLMDYEEILIVVATVSHPDGEIAGNLTCPEVTAIQGTDCELPIHISIEKDIALSPSTLGFELVIPEGYAFSSINGDETPEIVPAEGAENLLQFTWLDVPAFPVDLMVYLDSPGPALGTPAIEQVVFYRTSGGEFVTGTPKRAIIAGGSGECGGASMLNLKHNNETVKIDPPAISPHSADTNSDWIISLGELLRVIQFYNSAGYHCDDLSEDGYAPGNGDRDCASHSADYDSSDWNISLNELMRVIQFYNSLGYRPSQYGEDGFAPYSPPNLENCGEDSENCLNLIADLGAFLVAIGELTSADDILESTWDTGRLEHNENANVVYLGDGIPDVAEFALLNTILADEINLSAHGGAHHEFLNESYRHNLAQAIEDLPEQPATIKRAVAAYLTIGRYAMDAKAAEEVAAHLSASLDLDAYDAEASNFLAFSADADQDGASNLEEWLGATGQSIDPQGAIENFQKSATDPSNKHEEPEPPCSTCPFECPNPPHATLTLADAVTNVGGQPVTVVTISGSSTDCNHTELLSGQPVALREGTTVTISAENVDEAVGLFTYWNAEGLPIHLSGSASETFVVPAGGSFTITAQFTSTLPITYHLPATQIPTAYTLVVSGRGASATRTYNGNGAYTGVDVTAARNEPVNVSYSYSGSPGVIPGGWELYDNSISGDKATFIPNIGLPRLQDIVGIQPTLTILPYQNAVRFKAESPVGVPYIKASRRGTSTRIINSVEVGGTNGYASGIPEDIPWSYAWVGMEQYEVNPRSYMFKHKVKQKFTLTLCGEECKGYTTSSPAKRLFSPPIEGSSNTTEIVALSAHPMEGYEFVGWAGVGEFFRSFADAQADVNSVSVGSADANDGTIWIRMDHSKEFEPKFQEDKEYAIMSIESYGKSPAEGATSVGHSWIEIIDPCTDAWTSYGLMPDGQALDPVGSDVVKNQDLHRTTPLGYPNGTRYYWVTASRYQAILAHIAGIGDVYDNSYFTYVCTEFAVECVEIGNGEQLDAGAFTWTAPYWLAQDILEKEATRATSLSNPLPAQ